MTLALAKVSSTRYGASMDLGQLKAAIRMLAEPQGRIARRNARYRVLDALVKLRRELDRDYPAIKLPPKPRGPRRTPAEIRRELIAEGWVTVVSRALLEELAEARVPIRRTKEAVFAAPGSGYPKSYTIGASAWVPGWVMHYWPNRQRVAEAAKSATMRAAAKAAGRLGSINDHVIKGVISCPTQ